MENFNKLRVIDINSIDKSTVYIAVDSQAWRHPGKMSLENLQEPISIDPSSLIVNLPPISQNFFCEPFDCHDVSYNRPPLNASYVSAMHAAVDSNYLYIWVEKEQKWKRTPLSDW